jgi:glutathione S-transferase
MDLYFSPLACSLATRIALYEARLESETKFHNVTLSTKRTDDDGDYWRINAKGQVPALITREGELLTEGVAILQYVADLAPESGLAPPPKSFERYRLQQWLNFISTELHKQIFAVLFNPSTPPEAKKYASTTVLPLKFGYLDQQIKTAGDFLLGAQFTVADAYLVTVLNWTNATGIDLSQWSAIQTYHRRMLARSHVGRAVGEEVKLAGRA